MRILIGIIHLPIIIPLYLIGFTAGIWIDTFKYGYRNGIMFFDWRKEP